MALNDIDEGLLTAVGKGEIAFKEGSPEADVVALLKDAGARHLKAAAALKRAQQEIARAQQEAVRAEADREAAAKLLTILHRNALQNMNAGAMAAPAASTDASLLPDGSSETIRAKQTG